MDRRTGASPDESAEDPRAHPVRPSPAGDRDHPTPFDLVARGGGDDAKVLAAVKRRLDVGPKLAALVAEAVENTLTGRRDRDAPAKRRTVTLGKLDVSL